MYVGFVNLCGNICEFFLLNDEQKLCNLRLNVKFLTRTCNYLSVVGWEQHMCSDSRLGTPDNGAANGGSRILKFHNHSAGLYLLYWGPCFVGSTYYCFQT